jgi:hypothetical protein
MKDGETQILAGLISDEERTSAARLPGLGDLPIVGKLFSSERGSTNKTEIVLLITPRIVRNLTRPAHISRHCRPVPRLQSVRRRWRYAVRRRIRAYACPVRVAPVPGLRPYRGRRRGRLFRRRPSPLRVRNRRLTALRSNFACCRLAMRLSAAKRA